MDVKMINIENKKGQVTIFIILAMILVVGVAIIYVIIQKPSIVPLISYDKNPEGFIESCIKEKVKESVEILNRNGGYIQPQNFRLYQEDGVEYTLGYLCYNSAYNEKCVNQEPNLILHLENEISDYISNDLEVCFKSLKSGLESDNYNVVMGPMEFNTTLRMGFVVIDIDREVKMTIREDERELNNFKVTYSHPIYDIANVAIEIVNGESKSCFFRYEDYIRLYPKFDIKKFVTGTGSLGLVAEDDVKIYSIEDISSGKDFKFAIRSCARPPGNI